jgi:lipase chaperone LimK
MLELTFDNIKTLDYALADGIARQTAIIDQLKARPGVQQVGLTIRERQELLRSYDHLRKAVTAELKRGHRKCEMCGEPCADRFCHTKDCREAYYQKLEAAAELPVYRDRRPSPPRGAS